MLFDNRVREGDNVPPVLLQGQSEAHTSNGRVRNVYVSISCHFSGQDAVLDSAHELVCLFSQTEGEDLEQRSVMTNSAESGYMFTVCGNMRAK